ncbi:zinc ribbon domain-containing protein [Rubrivirga sp. S365]|uniref:double zinc ribbon domain-containing protein n=1 Tax=Rubrivirga sp. S365 TaxID=3076080 RepID=UPI0028C54895|nr:zinc ribbon domain-containing protein [Rubrivirga sp. S365]MDT7857262.1 zinc ribbon domain-containing protein [Rubrivirga sp. S365]
MSSTACASCGAAVRDGAAVCDLCGTTVDGPAASGDADGVVCPRCGHVAPLGSRFCNRCGERFEADEARAPSAPPRPAPVVGAAASGGAGASSAGAKRAFVVVGVGIAAVVLLYGATLLSADRDVPDAAPTAAADDLGPAGPVPDGTPALPDTLQAAADAFAAQGTGAGWYESGRYYLTAAFNASGTDPTASVQWARRAITDFEKSLELGESADVRVALAEAAAFDPANPMRPVQELQAALTADPANVPAHFLMGERRFLIGRLDSARASFERVLELAPPGDPLRERARTALLAVQQAEAPAG